ncbi:MAG: hypothetical protein IKN55_11140 [Oscillospiraceae bacterium]|nr:hypothetical protein [Oscillospiraceae bacterium]
MNERAEQIKAAMSDEAFVKSCIEAENEEAVQKLFADKGVEISLTEIELMKEMIGAVADGTLTEEQLEKLTHAGELTEEELTKVAGGDPGGRLSPLGHGYEDDFSEIASVASKKIESVTGSSGAGKIIGGIAIGVVAVGAIGYGVYKYKDDIVSGAETAYGWVKENITRW